MIKISFHVEDCDLFDDDEITHIVEKVFEHAVMITMEQGAQTLSVFAEDDEADEVLLQVQETINKHIPSARIVKIAQTPTVE